MAAMGRLKMSEWALLTVALFGACVTSATQCPWGRDPLALPLQSTCLCNINPESGALSVQCQLANFKILMRALQTYAAGDTVIENLYINNTTVDQTTLSDFMFKNLKIINLQISAAELTNISPNAFRGLENTLQTLNLAGNSLRSVPVQALRQLRLLKQLDLSSNQIKYVPDNAFVTLRLKTLKIADNNDISLSDNSLRGLESSLKNLNLKGCYFKQVPTAPLRNLKGLTFLDLAQNNLRKIEIGALSGLDSLTALNLERNAIQKLDPSVFVGVNDTLSSLSLLNNLLTEFPVQALGNLKELRVRTHLTHYVKTCYRRVINFFYAFKSPKLLIL